MKIKELNVSSLIEIYQESVDEVLKDIEKGIPKKELDNNLYEKTLVKLFSQALLCKFLENLKK